MAHLPPYLQSVWFLVFFLCRYSLSSSSSLFIFDSQLSDTGFYHCRVQLPGLFNDQTSTVHLIIINRTFTHPPFTGHSVSVPPQVFRGWKESLVKDEHHLSLTFLLPASCSSLRRCGCGELERTIHGRWVQPRLRIVHWGIGSKSFGFLRLATF